MPRPPKKTVDDKSKAPPQQPAVVAPAPVMPMPPPHQPQQPMQVGATPAPLAVHPQAHTRQIDVEGFIRVRDSVHQRLLTILELIKSFSVDYYRQTSLLLGEPAHEGQVPGIDLPLGQLEHAVQNMASMPGLMPVADFAAPVEEKKERKKRTHDPNAPKRPLTPYFLYMQTARPIIAKDLGADSPKGAVQEEGQRRWKAMGRAEKNGWNNAYQYNLRLYQARVHSYKHGGNPDARMMNDHDALNYADENNVALPQVDADTVGEEQEAIAEQLQQAAPADAAPADADPDPAPADDDETQPPSKTPKKGGGRKRKSDIVDETPKPAVATPDKKRRRTSKATDAEPKEEASTKKGSRSKKAKN